MFREQLLREVSSGTWLIVLYTEQELVTRELGTKTLPSAPTRTGF